MCVCVGGRLFVEFHVPGTSNTSSAKEQTFDFFHKFSSQQFRMVDLICGPVFYFALYLANKQHCVLKIFVRFQVKQVFGWYCGIFCR